MCVKDKATGNFLISSSLKFVVALLLSTLSAALVSGQDNVRVSSNGYSGTESAASQSKPQRSPINFDKGITEYGIWGGTSYDAPDLTQSRGRKVPLLVGLRYGRVISTKHSFALEYTIDLIPVAVVSLPGTTSTSGQTSRQYAVGVGITPVGLKAVFNRRSRFKLFAGISSGPIYFSRQVPVPGSARFNFISSGNAGIQIAKGEKRAITIGYDFSHVSNAGIGRINSGFNTNYLFVGFSVVR